MAVRAGITGAGIPEALGRYFVDVGVQRVGVGAGLVLVVGVGHQLTRQVDGHRPVQAKAGVPFRCKDHFLAVGTHAWATGILEVVVLAFQVAQIGSQAQVACQ
ncbi:hypothetical protein D3C81_1685710 [compost metagenome]